LLIVECRLSIDVLLELVAKPIAGGRERGAPRRAAGPSPVTGVFRPEDAVGLFADRPRA
jgi:hypothetical protein